MSRTVANPTSPPATPAGRYRPMLLVLLALIVGIWLDDSLHLRPTAYLVTALVSVAIWFPLWRIRNSFAIVPLFAIILSLSALRNDLHQSDFSANDLSRVAPASPSPIALEAIALTGARIIFPPESTPLDFTPQRPQTQILVEVQRVRDGQHWRDASGKTWLRVIGKIEEIGTGDRLQIFGEYSRRDSRGNPGEPDRSRQMEIDGVRFFLRCESTTQVTILERGSPFSLARWIGFQRQAWIARLHRALGEKQGSLAAAILLGAREQLDRPRMDAFLLVGMSHILVVSGANVAILAGALLWLQRVFGLPRTITFASIALFVIWFALLADADAPVARAAAGMLVLLIARFASRNADSVQAWSAAGAAVLLLNPAYLFSLGAQLSFLSVATLIEAASAMEPPRRKTDPLEKLIFASRPFATRWLIRLGEMLWDAIRTSIWVWLATTPLLWSYFGFLQWGPLLLNPLLVIPFVVTLWSGMLFLVTDGLIPGFAPLMGEVCRRSLDSMEWLVAQFQNSAAPTMLAPPPPSWWVMTFYVLATLSITLWPRARRRSLLFPISPSPAPAKSLAWRRWLFAAAIVWIFIGIGLGRGNAPNAHRTNEPLRITFLNVGHGSCVLLELPGGKTWVYDAGNKSDGRGAASILWQALLATRKTHLDRVIISHDDTDHYSALPTLLKRVRVDHIAWTEAFTPPKSPAGAYLANSITAAGVPTEVISDQTHWSLAGVTMRVLHPSPEETFGSDNSRSVVLEIEYAGRRILLPGDLETPGLELVISRDTKPYDVVMAPHHGSERSIPARFAGWSRPKYVVISGDEEDRHDSTIAAYASGGAEVFHTAEDGAIVFEIFADGKLTAQPLVR